MTFVAVTPPAQESEVTMRVTRIRSSRSFGKIITGHSFDLVDSFNDRSREVVGIINDSIFPSSEIRVGEIYKLTGPITFRVNKVNGYVKNERQIEAQSVTFLRPSGSQIVEWLTSNAKGIGHVKSQALYDRLGEEIFTALDEQDHDSVGLVITNENIRSVLFSTWLLNGDTATIRWAQEIDLPLNLVRKAWKFHGASLKSRITEDPYCLLSFCAEWKTIDRIATQKLGIDPADGVRIRAAIEEAAYLSMDSGHTCATADMIKDRVSDLLKPTLPKATKIYSEISIALSLGQVTCVAGRNDEDYIQSPGMHIMEKFCAHFIWKLVNSAESSRQQELFADDIDKIISEFESAESAHLSIPNFNLNEQQREAIGIVLSNNFSVITGGAGVGKTTVLKGVHYALQKRGFHRYQVALSGRAAARMAEATNEEACTIARFLISVDPESLGDNPVIIIDEASMVDVALFYRLLKKLPPCARLIIVGDPYQLPPISAGLVLQSLCNLPFIPTAKLTEVKRQSSESMIPVAAQNIRGGTTPSLSQSINDDISFIPCSFRRGAPAHEIEKQLADKVMSLYDSHPRRDDIQILCPTKGLSNIINERCHFSYSDKERPLNAVNSKNHILESSGFAENDALMYTENIWNRNLQNGCLGKLVEVFSEPKVVKVTEDDADLEYAKTYGKAVFEGQETHIFEEDLDNMEHSYSITVHKSQGSQFPIIIVPIRNSRLLDRTLVYTAVTRAREKVILVGDYKAFEKAITDAPKAFSRNTMLSTMLLKASTELY